MKYDYTGKTLFVGIDVHKKNYSVATVLEGEVVKRDTVKARPGMLISYLHKFFSGAKIFSAYEAGFSGFGLHRELVANGIENIVVHAASVEISSRDRVKTDKRDAQKIALQLSSGRLKCVHIPSPEREDSRELTRLRDRLVKERTRLANSIKAKAHYHGLIDPDDNAKVSERWIQDLLSDDRLGKNARYFLEKLAKDWRQKTEDIKEVNNLMKEQAEEDSKLERVYRSAPGIGPTAGRILANELEDMSHFSSEKQLFSYTGLTPCEYSSGEHKRQGHISRQGKSQLRRILVQSAWIAIRYDKDLEAVYLRIAKRAGGKRAILGVARRLIGRLRSCFRTEDLYHPYERPLKVA